MSKGPSKVIPRAPGTPILLLSMGECTKTKSQGACAACRREETDIRQGIGKRMRGD